MLDDELAALWRKEIEHERNRGFELAVLRRIERVLYRRALISSLAMVAAATLLLAIFAPLLTAIWRQTFAHFVSAPIVALLLLALSMLLSKMTGNYHPPTSKAVPPKAA